MLTRPRIALCLEYPLGLAGGVSVLVGSLIRGLAAHYRTVLVSPDTAESLAATPLGDLIEQHLPWNPDSTSAQQSRALAQAIARAEVSLAHFHFGGNFGWHNRFPRLCPIPSVARSGVPVVTTVHMAVGLLHGYCGPQKPLWFKLGFLPWAWQSKLRVLRHVRREIAVSLQDFGRLRRWYWPLRKRFEHIYHSTITPPAAVSGPCAPRERIVLSAGHVAQRKGQPVLAEAFAEISPKFPEWKLFIAGHMGEEVCRPQIEAAAARCARPKQICLLGRREDTAQLMRRAAVFVQPSFHEGLPLALQEALFHQCACLATRIPGNIELVEDQETGLLVPPGDIKAMSAALARLLGDERLREALAGNSRASVLRKQMTAPQMIDKHLRLYEGILERS